MSDRAAAFDTHLAWMSGAWLGVAGGAGEWVPLERLRIPVDDLGFRQAATIVERLRTYGGRIFEADAHLRRWQNSSELVGIGGLPEPNELHRISTEMLRRNERLLAVEGDVGIVWFATPGMPGSGVPTVGVHLTPLDHRGNESKRTLGQPLVVTEVQQPSPSSWPREAKVRCRLHYYLADTAAKTLDPEAVGVLLDQDGTVTETSIANLAIVERTRILSPPRSRVLAGVTQRVVERSAAEAGIVWIHEPISPERLRGADEVLLMGTDAGLWFARSVDGTPPNVGIPGPVFAELRRRFDETFSSLNDGERGPAIG